MQTTMAIRSDCASATCFSSAPSEPETTTTAISPPGIDEQIAVIFCSPAIQW